MNYTHCLKTTITHFCNLCKVKMQNYAAGLGLSPLKVWPLLIHRFLPIMLLVLSWFTIIFSLAYYDKSLLFVFLVFFKLLCILHITIYPCFSFLLVLFKLLRTYISCFSLFQHYIVLRIWILRTLWLPRKGPYFYVDSLWTTILFLYWEFEF